MEAQARESFECRNLLVSSWEGSRNRIDYKDHDDSEVNAAEEEAITQGTHLKNLEKDRDLLFFVP